MSGKKIKKLMIDHEMTVKTLAELTGFTATHLSRVINGRVESERAIRSIAFALGVPFEEIRDRRNEDGGELRA